jgi:excisionase family DNA binding protein
VLVDEPVVVVPAHVARRLAGVLVEARARWLRDGLVLDADVAEAIGLFERLAAAARAAGGVPPVFQQGFRQAELGALSADDDDLSTGETAGRLGVSPSLVRRYARQGRLRCTEGVRGRRFARADVEAFAASRVGG